MKSFNNCLRITILTLFLGFIFFSSSLQAQAMTPHAKRQAMLKELRQEEIRSQREIRQKRRELQAARVKKFNALKKELRKNVNSTRDPYEKRQFRNQYYKEADKIMKASRQQQKQIIDQLIDNKRLNEERIRKKYQSQ